MTWYMISNYEKKSNIYEIVRKFLKKFIQKFKSCRIINFRPGI